MNVSYGVILIKINNDDKKILMINRKNSLCYIDFMRGKYKMNNLDYINKLISRMSIDEINNIKTKNFDYLWRTLWNIPEKNNYKTKKEYIISYNKFTKIKPFINYDIGFSDSEWEIPKGKKKKNETNKEAACRELEEETNIKSDDYEIVENIVPLIEKFKGEDNNNYTNIYYFGICNNDSNIFFNKDNQDQINEIKDLGFLSKEDAIKKIRDYSFSKKQIILDTFEFINNTNFTIK
tara:strand:+ start:2692 stop:3399 length:708 start_codon:yes stop_codon:yes gene_type:complete